MSAAYDALGPEAREVAAGHAARLAHDVGKYIARMARNISAEGPVPAALVPLLVKDLFELAKGRRASAVYRELAEPLAAMVDEPRLRTVEARLSQLDELEVAVRAGEESAVRAAAELAREVEAALRAVAADARGAT